MGGVLLKESISFIMFKETLEQIPGSDKAILSYWEVFTFFEMLNQTYAKVFYEPQRCQSVTWSIVYKFIAN